MEQADGAGPDGPQDDPASASPDEVDSKEHEITEIVSQEDELVVLPKNVEDFLVALELDMKRDNERKKRRTER